MHFTNVKKMAHIQKMEAIDECDNPNSEPSVDSSDKCREEMKWGTQQEEQIVVWQAQCEHRSNQHAVASKAYKSLYYS